MAIGRVIPHRLPACPGRDSRFTIRRNFDKTGEPWWVYYELQARNRVPADHPHEELVELVNTLKKQMGNERGGGGFSINEHGQVIARTAADSGHGGNAVHVIGVRRGRVLTYLEPITFQNGRLDPRATPQEGEPWTGPLCGMTYKFAAVGNPQPPSRNLDEVFVEIEGEKHQLSVKAMIRPYPPTSGPLFDFLRALRRLLTNGGRFRVNEHARAFTSDQLRYIGRVPIKDWFPPLSARA